MQKIVVKIGTLVFYCCDKITKFEIPGNVFYGSVSIDQSYHFKSLGITCPNIAITSSDFMKIKMIPPQVSIIGDYCFSEINTLTSLVIPTNIKNK